MTQRFLITGATGFVGGHLAEACVARGYTVRAIVRPQSDVTHLNQLGVTLIRGELHDADVLAKALTGVQYVVHAAAKVGDWGPVDDYRAVNVVAFRRLLDACKTRPLERFVHLSSLGVYAARHHYGTDETEPLPEQHIDGYTQSKVESEQLAMEKPDAVGKIYNLTDGELVSKRQFIDAVADGMKIARPKANLPLWVARIMAHTMEKRARKKNKQSAPKLTQARLKFLGLNLDYSIEKARRELGYVPRTPFAQAIEETMAWYRANL
jgi:nucleoside-diphosphate-sugar epimerase